MKRIALHLAVAIPAAAVLATGCGTDAPGTPAVAASSSSSAVTTPSSSASIGPVPSDAAASTSTPAWSSGPVTVRRQPPVPPVPVVTAIRYASHAREGFDRIVVDISGAQPGYSVRYVSEVRADPSDRKVLVPGRRHLLLVLNPAQAHRDGGSTTVSGTHRTGLPVLKAYAVVGDFEGHVSIALGLDDVVGYRVGELPGRIYLDLAA